MRSHNPSPLLNATASCFVAAFLFAASSPAQEATQRPESPVDVFEEEIVVTEVLLDVLVTDRQGNVIIGLGPEDFVVKEKGEEHAVTGVTFYSNRRALDAPDGESAAAERSDRYFILLFHDQRLSLPSLTPRQLETGHYVQEWASSQLLPNDHVAVLGYDVKLKVYEDFTNDKEILLPAIDGAVRGKKARENWPSRLEEATDPDSPSLLANLPQGRALSKQTRRIQQALQVVGEAAAPIVGRKNLIFFSVGYGRVNSVGQYQPDIRFYPPMMQALNDGNVAVYSIDWLPTARGGNPITRSISDALSLISTDTGGHYYFSFQTALVPLREVSNENNGYYLLSYRSRYPAGTSGYRQVKVEARNPQFRVRGREGYRFGS